MQENITIKLQKPITFGSEMIFELILTPPKAKHFRGLSTNIGMDEILTLAGKLSGQPNAVMDELSIPDMQTVMETIRSFLDSGQPIGKMS